MSPSIPLPGGERPWVGGSQIQSYQFTSFHILSSSLAVLFLFFFSPNFILAVRMRRCLGPHSCTCPILSIAILNGIYCFNFSLGNIYLTVIIIIKQSRNCEWLVYTPDQSQISKVSLVIFIVSHDILLISCMQLSSCFVLQLFLIGVLLLLCIILILICLRCYGCVRCEVTFKCCSRKLPNDRGSSLKNQLQLCYSFYLIQNRFTMSLCYILI